MQSNTLWIVVAALLVVAAAFTLASPKGGRMVMFAITAAVAGIVVVRRPAIGIIIYVTTFLFTYPSFLR